MWLLWVSAALAGGCEYTTVLARTPSPAGEQSRIDLSDLRLAAAQWTLQLRYARDRARKVSVIKEAVLTADYLVENGRSEVAWTLGLPLRSPSVATDVSGVAALQQQALDPERYRVPWHACETDSTRSGTSWLAELPGGPSRVRSTHRLQGQAVCELHLVQNPNWPPQTTQLRVEHTGPRRASLQLPPGAREVDGVHRWQGAGDVHVTLEGC